MEWFLAIVTLKRFVNKINPDVLIGYRLTSYGFLAAIIGFKPLVLAAQGETDVWPPGRWTTRIKERLARYAVKRADLIHAWANHMAHSIYELDAAKEKVFILPRGIDISKFSFPFIPVEHSTMTLAVTRGLAPEYHHISIFKATKILLQMGIPVTVSVAGEGSYKPELERSVSELGLQDAVKFLGRLSNDQLRDLLKGSMVYVSMPDTEGVSASLLEAMACYCIPVVSDLPANRFWIQNSSNGFLVPVSDHKALANTLSDIWQNRHQFENLLKSNRSIVEKNASMEANTRIFVEKYKNIVKCVE